MRPSSVSSTAPLSCLTKSLAADLPAVEKRERQPVGQDGTQLLHQVEREARASRPVAMQEADGRIEPDALRRAAAIVGQQRVEEREQRVDRVERRAARAPAEDDVGVGDADQVVENAEIDVAGLAFGAAQSVRPRRRRGRRAAGSCRAASTAASIASRRSAASSSP